MCISVNTAVPHLCVIAVNVKGGGRLIVSYQLTSSAVTLDFKLQHFLVRQLPGPDQLGNFLVNNTFFVKAPSLTSNSANHQNDID